MNPYDLVVLPKNLVREGGGIGPIVLVYKMSKYIHVVDAFSSWNSIRTYEIDAKQYWGSPFHSLTTAKNLSEFQVINIEKDDDNGFNISRTALRFQFSFVRVELMRCSDNKIFMANSHLGE